MRVEIISIGDELLIGQTVNTNASWMGKQISELGGVVQRCTVIKDEEEDILLAIGNALEVAEVVLVTGGLGPTKDDITKKTLCNFFETEMTMNEEVLDHVKSFFEARGRELLDVNRDQALVPEKAKVLFNKYGTAPGMWFDTDDDKVVVSMPGVPYEMQFIMNEHVLPDLEKRYAPEGLYYETIQTQGIGESTIAQRIADIEDELREEGLGLAYLPSPGGVRLRVSGKRNHEQVARVQEYISKISGQLDKYVFGFQDEALEVVVGRLLSERNETVSTVESCTGGAVAAAITSVPGSSDYFEGSIVSYSNNVKMHQVGVNENTLEQFGAVSQQVVEEMAKGGRDKLNTDYCVALSGIAGPDGGSEDKPVGTVWIAIASKDRVFSKKFLFENERSRNIRRSVLTALNLLRCEILKINIEKS